MADEGSGARGIRAIERQRRQILRMRVALGVLVIALGVAIVLPRDRPDPIAAPAPAETVTEAVTEMRTEARLVMQETVPQVVPRRLPEQELRADVFELRVQPSCGFRALNYDVPAEVTNTSAALAGGVRVRLIFFNVDEQWIGAADGDLPVLEPGATAAVTFSPTVPCKGQMGSQTVTRIEASLL